MNTCLTDKIVPGHAKRLTLQPVFRGDTINVPYLTFNFGEGKEAVRVMSGNLLLEHSTNKSVRKFPLVVTNEGLSVYCVTANTRGMARGRYNYYINITSNGLITRTYVYGTVDIV